MEDRFSERPLFREPDEPTMPPLCVLWALFVAFGFVVLLIYGAFWADAESVRNGCRIALGALALVSVVLQFEE